MIKLRVAYGIVEGAEEQVARVLGIVDRPARGTQVGLHLGDMGVDIDQVEANAVRVQGGDQFGHQLGGVVVEMVDGMRRGGRGGAAIGVEPSVTERRRGGGGGFRVRGRSVARARCARWTVVTVDAGMAASVWGGR